jgi:hypothetical protein
MEAVYAGSFNMEAVFGVRPSIWSWITGADLLMEADF